MTWTKIPKPTAPAWTKIPKPEHHSSQSFSGGDPIGLLLALTYSTVTTISGDGWTKIPKPTD